MGHSVHVDECFCILINGWLFTGLRLRHTNLKLSNMKCSAAYKSWRCVCVWWLVSSLPFIMSRRDPYCTDAVTLHPSVQWGAIDDETL